MSFAKRLRFKKRLSAYSFVQLGERSGYSSYAPSCVHYDIVLIKKNVAFNNFGPYNNSITDHSNAINLKNTKNPNESKQI